MADPQARLDNEVGAGHRPPRCPLCADNTAATDGTSERCVRPGCNAQRIVRNNRGDAWVWDADHRLVHRPNRHPLPVDQTPGRGVIKTPDPNRYAGPDPQELPADNEWFQVTPHGTAGFGRRVKEPRK